MTGVLRDIRSEELFTFHRANEEFTGQTKTINLWCCAIHVQYSHIHPPLMTASSGLFFKESYFF